MNIILAVGFLVILFSLFLQFARQEYFQEYYEKAIGDVEGRLAWANSRTTFPFGMKSQLKVSRALLRKAKGLWKANRWQEAYRVSLQSQQAMDRAQSIYNSAIKTRRR